MTCGKAFRAEIGNLTADEETSLRTWGDENCASSVVLRESGNVVWLCVRERAFTKVNFMRSTRSLLKRLGVDTNRLKNSRSWLILIATFTVDVEAKASRGRCVDIPSEMGTDERTIRIPDRRARAGKEDVNVTTISRDER
jgi:hypothetical protein